MYSYHNKNIILGFITISSPSYVITITTFAILAVHGSHGFVYIALVSLNLVVDGKGPQ